MDYLKLNKKKHEPTYYMVLMFALSLFPYNSLCQSIAEELGSINKAYLNVKEYSCSISYRVYRNYSSEEPVESLEGKCFLKGSNYYWKTGDQVVVQNSRFFLSIDNVNKNILVGEPRNRKSPFLNFPLDSIISLCSDSKLEELKNGKKRITLNFNVPLDNVSKLVIIKSGSNFISNIEMYYQGFVEDPKEPVVGSTPRLEIAFKQTKESFAESIFDYENYFLMKNKKLVPNQKYLGYFIIDQRISK